MTRKPEDSIDILLDSTRFMQWQRGRFNAWMLWVMIASAQHLSWGALLLAFPGASGATPLSSIGKLLGSIEAWALIGAALLAVTGLVVDKMRPESTLGLLACLPQQVLLAVSATGSVVAAWYGEYADGTVINSPHILADQIPTILILVGHTAALLMFHGRFIFSRKVP